MALQLLRQGHDIDPAALAHQLAHTGEHAAMRIEGKIRGLDAARRLLIMAVVEQDGAQDRHLRGQVSGQSLGVRCVVTNAPPL